MNSKIKNLVLFGTIVAILCTKVKLTEFNSDTINIDHSIDYQGSKDDDFTIIAHRGFSSLEIENSKEAIIICNNYEYIDGIEIDIAMTSDNNLVVIHADENGYNSNLKQPIYKFSLEELKKKNYKANVLEQRNFVPIKLDNFSKALVNRSLKLYQKEASIITLDELLSFYNEDKLLIIDVKFNIDKDIMIKQLFDQLVNIDCSNIIIQSSDYESLEKMKSIKPHLIYQLIISNKKQLKYLDTDIERFAIRHNLINQKIIEKLTSENKKVSIWTINDLNKINILIEKLGDFAKDVVYITDYPDYISMSLNKEKNKFR